MVVVVDSTNCQLGDPTATLTEGHLSTTWLTRVRFQSLPFAEPSLSLSLNLLTTLTVLSYKTNNKGLKSPPPNLKKKNGTGWARAPWHVWLLHLALALVHSDRAWRSVILTLQSGCFALCSVYRKEDLMVAGE